MGIILLNLWLMVTVVVLPVPATILATILVTILVTMLAATAAVVVSSIYFPAIMIVPRVEVTAAVLTVAILTIAMVTIAILTLAGPAITRHTPQGLMVMDLQLPVPI